MTTITIPKELIKEKELILIPRRDYEKLLELLKKRKITTKSKKVIPKSQEWFWTKEWQKKEKEADQELARGEYKEFKNVKDLLKDIHS
ncbi:MAG: hypothetical protein WBC21_03350 [Minisyncoccales bacterium]